MRRQVTFEPQAFADFRRLLGRSGPFAEDLSLVVTQQICFIDQFGTSGSDAVIYEDKEAWSRELPGKYHLVFQLSDDDIHIFSCRQRRK